MVNIKTRHLSWILAVALVVFLGVAILFYWQDAITLGSLAFWILGLVIVGLFFIFGTRVAQKDGFINGFRNGRDGVKKTRKEN